MDADHHASEAGHGTPPAAPNHHADHAGFSGPIGAVMALVFLVGRARAADLAVELAGLVPGERVVDIGCGPGVAVARAGAAGAEVVGVDPAQVMLRVAGIRWRRRRGLAWRAGSAESLPVTDGWAHVVWSLSTVHHWADLDAGIAEAGRVLAPGGRLVVVERRIADPGASGAASHGWTPAQAETFGRHCEQHRFAEVEVSGHPGARPLLSVVARAPEPRSGGIRPSVSPAG